ncbi:BamA/TamA family outer membrane protein [Longimicrobium sp.]|jgi:hypothetical protein|uniref:BamA/TamA family outer membrane protein n=1 Tax=Longimicrobium sp. TaxID=2029185 RepID=UPI002EDB1268
MLLATVLAALLQGTSGAAPAPAPRDTTAAYADPGTRTLVTAARERRARVERTIDAYSVTARERMHASVEALSRNRTLFGKETAVRIDWRRDGQSSVRVLGAREASPATSSGISLPGDLLSEAADPAFDPDRLQLSLFSFGGSAQRTEEKKDTTESNEREVSINVDMTPIDPLSQGSEGHYRFRSGDTTTVRMQDGGQLRMIQLEVIPRRREFRLLRGTLWIDAATGGVVRSVMTTARPFDLREDAEDISAAITAAGPVRFAIRYVTVEYALWQNRFWLPRLTAVDAQMSMGMLAGVPVRFERSYADYEVTASPVPQSVAHVAATRSDTAAVRACTDDAEATPGLSCHCTNGGCRVWRVEVPTDTAALLASADLPEPLAQGAGKLITGEEVESLARVLTPRLGDLAPEMDVSLLSLRNMRFNRVEGLSLGAAAEVTYGPLRADGTVRLGLADLEPNVELGVARQTMFWRTRLAGYRRLTPFDRESPALGFGASVAALLLGRDEADYFRATGAEITGEPLRAAGWTYTWRLFGEHQHGVSKNTDLSLARVWEGSDVFRSNRPANRADQAGAGLTLRREFGTDRSPVQLLTGVGAEGQTGTFDYGRGSVFARMTAPFTSRLAFALEGAAGTTTGDVPTQGEWYVGGTQSVRGYEGALQGGTAFWRARAELATPTPAARLVVFGDAGWAGSRSAWSRDPRLLSAGVGASFLDGLIRMDLSHALRTPRGWRLDLYLDAAL